MAYDVTQQFTYEDYQALMQIVIGILLRPSETGTLDLWGKRRLTRAAMRAGMSSLEKLIREEGRDREAFLFAYGLPNASKPIEPFGKLIRHVDVMPMMIRLSCFMSATWKLRKEIFKDMNVLFLKGNANFSKVLDHEAWPLWCVPVLEQLPLMGDQTLVQAEVTKYVMNVYAVVHRFVFQNKEDFNGALNRTIRLVEDYAGRASDTIALTRLILCGLVGKLSNPKFVRLLLEDIHRLEWNNLFKLTAIIEDFLFYR